MTLEQNKVAMTLTAIQAGGSRFASKLVQAAVSWEAIRVGGGVGVMGPHVTI